MREQKGHSKSSKFTTTTFADLAPRVGRPETSILLISSAKGSLVKSNLVSRIMLVRSFDSRNFSSFCLPSPLSTFTETLSYPGMSLDGVMAPTLILISAGME